MNIYTKTGDKGETGLLNGKRVPKTHYRIEAYGTVDELNSFLGLLIDKVPFTDIIEILKPIQSLLFTLGSNLASDAKTAQKFKLPQITEDDILQLEAEMDKMDSQLPEMRNFVLPTGHELVSLCHIVRTICRRAERRVIEVSFQEEIDEKMIKFLNRLSDFIFVLARYLTQKLDIQEFAWKPKK